VQEHAVVSNAMTSVARAGARAAEALSNLKLVKSLGKGPCVPRHVPSCDLENLLHQLRHVLADRQARCQAW
jgi:hypothetical protein